MTTPNKEVETLAKNMHEWYLEATSKLSPVSSNPNAQRSYEQLTEEQKSIDRYIANKVSELLSLQAREIIELAEGMSDGDGKPHDDTRELHQAIAWQEGYNLALSSLISKLKERYI